MKLLRRSRSSPDPAVVRVSCADCHTPEHPGVLSRLNGRLVCLRCYRVAVRRAA